MGGVGALMLLWVWAPSVDAAGPAQATFLLRALWVQGGLTAALFLWWWRSGARREPPSLALLLALLALTRCLVSPLPPVFSEDLWRYLWDGGLQWLNAPTYLWAPSDPSFDQLLQDTPELAALRGWIGHPTLPTIYPPGAQLLFRLSVAVEISLRALRGALFLGEALSLVALYQLLEGKPRLRALLLPYTLSPFICFEGSNHLEPWGIAALLWGFLWFKRGGALRAGVCLGLGVSIKLLPALALACLFGASERWRARLWLITGALIGALLVTLPFWSELPRFFSNLSHYGAHWRANDGVFALLHQGVDAVISSCIGERPWRPPEPLGALLRALVDAADPGGRLWPDELRFSLTKLIAGLLWLITAGALSWETLTRRARPPVERAGLLFYRLLFLLLLLSPVVHPWYLLWLCPCALWSWGLGAKSAPLVALWSVTAPLAYHARFAALAGEGWRELPLISALEYLPLIFCSLLLYRHQTSIMGESHHSAGDGRCAG